MNVYPVPPCAASLTADGGGVPGGGVLMVGFRLADVVPPLRNGRPLAAGDRSALVIGGTEEIRTGDAVVFLKAVAVASARVRRQGGFRRRAARFITRRWGLWRTGWRTRPGRA